MEWDGEDIKGATSQPQSMIVWPGQELIGSTRGLGKATHGIVQGVVYTVRHVDGASLVVEMNEEHKKKHDSDDEGPSAELLTMPLTEAPRVLRLTHAMCYFTVQGRTLKGKHICLLDTGHTWFSRRALIVGTRRATHGAYVRMAIYGCAEFITGRRRRYIKDI